jgi:hypothetical protein
MITLVVGDLIQCAPVQPGIPQAEQGARQVHLSGPLLNSDVICLSTNHRVPDADEQAARFREAISRLRQIAERGQSEVPEAVWALFEQAGVKFFTEESLEEQIASVAAQYDADGDAHVAAQTHATLNQIAELIRVPARHVVVKTRLRVHQLNFSSAQIHGQRGAYFVRQLAGTEVGPNLEKTIRHQLLNSPTASRVVPEVQKLWVGQKVLVTANLRPVDGVVNGLQTTIRQFVRDGQNNLLGVQINLPDGGWFVAGMTMLNQIGMPGIGRCYEVGIPLAPETLQTFNKFQGVTLSGEHKFFVEVNEGMPSAFTSL